MAKRTTQPRPTQRPKRAKNGAWECSQLFAYLRSLEAYADYLEWRLNNPQQESLWEKHDAI